MKFNSEQQKVETISRLSLISLMMVLGSAIVMAAIGYLVTQERISQEGFKLDLLTEVIFLVALSEFPAAFFVRKSLMAKLSKTTQSNSPEIKLNTISVIMAAFAMAISTYGLVIVLLGNKFEMLFLFVAISLIHYQLFRLRLKDFDDIKNEENELHPRG